MKLLSKQQWHSCFCNKWLGKTLCSSGVAFYKINWNINGIRLTGVWHDVSVIVFFLTEMMSSKEWTEETCSWPHVESDPVDILLFLFWGFRNWPSNSKQGNLGSFLCRAERQSAHVCVVSPLSMESSNMLEIVFLFHRCTY